MNEKIVQVFNLNQHFSINNKLTIKAVNDVSFYIYKGEFLGLIGESGSGKSTLGKSIMQINRPTSGRVYFYDKEISNKKVYNDEKKWISRNMQMTFQDSVSSLNPRMLIKDIIEEPLFIQRVFKTKDERMNKVYELMDLVGLDRIYGEYFPYECSGGMRQRVGIARALALNPKVLIADEPIASLDISIQAQIINLFIKLKKEMGLTCLFISHDLRMIRYVCDRVAVMNKGSIVEIKKTNDLFNNPSHEYTKKLISSMLFVE